MRSPTLPKSSFGIGVITYNRLNSLEKCLTNIFKHTKCDYTLVVADDGSTDGSVEYCKDRKIIVLTGENRGVCWNKNRALYTLYKFFQCDDIILIEDDCFVVCDNWEDEWIRCSKNFHHINCVNPWWDRKQLNGNGTSDSPWLSNNISGQCTITSRFGLEKVGFLNPLFRGYGFGHIEWTKRFFKTGLYDNDKFFKCLDYGIMIDIDNKSFRNEDDMKRNQKLLMYLTKKPFRYVQPWTCSADYKIFLDEITQGIFF